MDDARIEMLEVNISMLQTYGLDYSNTIQSILLILRKSIKGEMQIEQEDIERFFDIAIRASEKHQKLLKLTLKERMTYADDDK